MYDLVQDSRITRSRASPSRARPRRCVAGLPAAGGREPHPRRDASGNAFRLSTIAPDDPVQLTDEATPQFTQLVDDEAWGRYLQGLKRLNARDRRLLVGRAGLG